MCISSLEQSVLTPGLDLQEVQRSSQRLLFSSVWSLLIQRIPLMVEWCALLFSTAGSVQLLFSLWKCCIALHPTGQSQGFLCSWYSFSEMSTQTRIYPENLQLTVNFFGGGHTLDFTVLQQSFVWIHRNPYCNMYSKLLAMHCVLVAF